MRSSQLRNLQSARVSFPGQLKRIETGETATYELESGVALISCSATTESRPHLSRPGTKSEGAHRLPGMAEDEMAEREEADETISNAPGGNSHSSRSCELSHDTVNVSLFYSFSYMVFAHNFSDTSFMFGLRSLFSYALSQLSLSMH